MPQTAMLLADFVLPADVAHIKWVLQSLLVSMWPSQTAFSSPASALASAAAPQPLHASLSAKDIASYVAQPLSFTLAMQLSVRT